MKKTIEEIQAQMKITDAHVFGEHKVAGDKLFIIFWQRLANSGMRIGWGQDEADVVSKWGYNLDFVKHIVVEINPASMPVEVGVEA